MIALGSPTGWVALFVPVFLLLLLFQVTGIPETEAQALRSRGDDYRRYQNEVSIFVPWRRSGRASYSASGTMPSCSSAWRAASCSAAFLVDPRPTPSCSPSITAAQTKRRSWAGPSIVSTRY